MKINILILIVIFILASGWGVYTQQKPPQFDIKQAGTDNEVTQYLKAPNFTYTDVQGKEGDLYDYKGQVVLLHFWATWCAPCLVEFPELMALADQKQDNLVVLAVSTDHDPEAIPRFLNRFNLNIPDNFIIIPDENKSITQDLYQTFKLPETFLIDGQSNIIEKLIGPQEGWNNKEWHTKIESIPKKLESRF